MRKILIIAFLLVDSLVRSQELNCVVYINDIEIGVSNRQIFTTMQNAISEYMNNTKWTDLPYRTHEKIDCSLTINILDNPEGNLYTGRLQLQVSRPVYNSTYKTPVLNFNDNDISFNYEEYQPLVYNRNSFDSNLVSLLTFYAYTIIGFQADTFSLYGGQTYFEEAENTVNQAQQGGGRGWNNIDGNYTRYKLNENLLSVVFENFRKAMYTYHLHGLDRMVEDQTQALNTIADSIILLEEIYDDRPNTFLIRVFMDTKSDEIVDIFSDGPRIETRELRDVLTKIFSALDQKWAQIKI